jgi:transposase
MARPIRALTIDSDQMKGLKSVTGRRSSPQRMVMRANIVLLRGQGLSQQEVAARLGVERVVVSKWENRFRKGGVAGLDERRRSGRPPRVAQTTKASILHEAVRPPKRLSRWSTRTMAKAKGVSNATVHRLWKANDIKPHLTRTFKISNDKDFEPKFWDVIGLYLNPPDKALVFCCDEKSQCQALERTQPGLPLGIGHVRTATHDYIRHGTLTLFAALNYLDGRIIRRTAQRHTHAEWLAFLKQIDSEAPQGLTLHMVVDNYSTHKHPKVKSWIQWRNQRHARTHGAERIVLHFTPTSSSWMNLVERFFRDLTEDAIREGSFTSIRDLEEAIESYLAERDEKPKRYVWKAEGQEILAKIHRARTAMETTHEL